MSTTDKPVQADTAKHQIAALISENPVGLDADSINGLTKKIKQLKDSGYKPTPEDTQLVSSLQDSIQGHGNSAALAAARELGRSVGTRQALAEAALKSAPAEPSLSAEDWANMHKGGASNLLSHHNLIDSSGHLNMQGLREAMKKLVDHIFHPREHGVSMASNGSLGKVKFDDNTPVNVPKDIQPIDPATGKPPAPQADNTLGPGIQPMAMNMQNTMGMKPV